jgi:hypothetical protein
MNRAWLLLWVLVILQIAAWTFAPVDTPASAPTGDGEPLDPIEAIRIESRNSQRKDAMAALDLPWRSRCGEDRKGFISGTNQYYYHRQNQSERYPEIHGKLGAKYIADQWSTSDDRRIERLTQEAYARGYLKPADFEPVARKLVAAVIKDERVTGKGCAD